MNTTQKLLSILKIALLTGLCLYTVLSSVFYLYLQIHFLDPIAFPKIAAQMLTTNTVLLLELFLSLKALMLPERLRPSDRRTELICAAVSCVIFLCHALRCGSFYPWISLLCAAGIMGIAVYLCHFHKTTTPLQPK